MSDSTAHPVSPRHFSINRAVTTWVYSIMWKTLDVRLCGHDSRGVIPA